MAGRWPCPHSRISGSRIMFPVLGAVLGAAVGFLFVDQLEKSKVSKSSSTGERGVDGNGEKPPKADPDTLKLPKKGKKPKKAVEPKTEKVDNTNTE